MHRTKRLLAPILTLVLLALAVPARAQDKVLRFVQNGNLTILDPIWTTAYVTRNHGYLIYDTLFARDENSIVKPQMVDSYEVSADKTVWTFKLRDGLEWHDGNPVTSADCIPSIRRWGARDAMGMKLMSFVKELTAIDARSFQMVLKEPYGLVLDSLGKPSAMPAFIMPKAVAETDPHKQIDSQIGSGPFIYQKNESKAGEKHVYVKNPRYVPRREPPSGLSGGKVVKVDRVDIIEMPDPQQQMNAIIAGEIDLIEQPPHDLLPVLKKAKDVQLFSWNPFGHQFVFRINHVVKPFDNPKIRMAALLALRQEDYLKATVGDPEYYKVCTAAFICGTPNAFDAPGELFVKPDFEKARALLMEAGYDGTPVVVLQSTTLPILTNTAPVTKALLEQAGFKVDMQSMDFQTLATRRTRKDPPDKGGWNILHTFAVAADIMNPISTAFMGAQGDKSLWGWPTDPEMERLRDAYARETDPAQAKALAGAVQARAIETAQYGWLGQWYGPGVARATITGWLKAPVPVMWNIEKK